jgi:hypothetical protein
VVLVERLRRVQPGVEHGQDGEGPLPPVLDFEQRIDLGVREGHALADVEVAVVVALGSEPIG